ncbi:MAG: hypothetical protein Q8M16_09270 [Pirellulaceae bacterium]|nr:hypothetical protein [Pirellulaceae bacterium]
MHSQRAATIVKPASSTRMEGVARRLIACITRSVGFVFLLAWSATSAYGFVPQATDLKELQKQAYQLQSEREWCQSLAVWQQIQSKLASGDSNSRLKVSADQNIHLLKYLCEQNENAPATSESVEIKGDERIGKIDWPRYYPVGRVIRSSAITTVSGVGQNRNWLLSGEQHFISTIQVQTETKVIKSTNEVVEVEITFADVSEALILSGFKLRIDIKLNPLAGILFERARALAIRFVPGTVIVEDFVEAATLVDPALEKTLTALAETFGYDQQAMKVHGVKTEELAGSRFLVQYRPRFAMTKIKALDDKTYTNEQFQDLAVSLGLLIDSYVMPNLNAKPQDRWSIDAADAVRVLNLGMQTKAEGTVQLEFQQERTIGEEKLARLHIVPGSDGIKAVGTGPNRGYQGTFLVQSGWVNYNLDDLFIRESEVSFGVRDEYLPPGSLLFGTTSIRDLEIVSRYRADIEK